MRLEAERLRRTKPANLQEADKRLFEHEFERFLNPVEPIFFDAADFFPNGYLTGPGNWTPLAESFQGAVPRGLSRLKARLKVTFFRLTSSLQLGRTDTKKGLVITDEFSNGYFHWLGDCLPKLQALQGELDRYRLVLPAYLTRFSYVRESLSLWPELEVTFLDPHRIVRLRGLEVIPALAPTGNFRPSLMVLLGKALRAKFAQNPGGGRRLYISRRKAPFRRILNEDQVEAALKKFGFETVVMEDLDFASQVKLCAQSSYLVSNHGAGLTNLLFMPPGGRVLEIRQRGDSANNCYFALASDVSLRYDYLLAESATKTDAHQADLKVDPILLEKALKIFMSEEET